jgi:2-amino-4-hydroxy-6-hydroxymethyldihydropteridine diphosphokinase
MEARAFVLMPLAEVAPSWRHPVTGMFVQKLIEGLPEGQEIEISGRLAA